MVYVLPKMRSTKSRQCKFCMRCGCSLNTASQISNGTENLPKRKKKLGKGASIAIVLIIFVIFIALIIAIGSGDDETTSELPQSSDTVQTIQDANKLIFEDDIIKVSYIRVYDYEGLTGASYLQLLIENKSDKTINPVLTNVSINNMTATSGTGVPIVISPNNSSKQPFILFTGNTDVEKAEDIENLSFKIFLFDYGDVDNICELEETPLISVSCN